MAKKVNHVGHKNKSQSSEIKKSESIKQKHVQEQSTLEDTKTGANDGGGEAVLYFGIAVAITCCKFLMLHSYRSTDYEVHRNWLAITHSSPLQTWYYEKTSEWTLDYPPFFAWFEFLLSQFAPLFDKEMLKVSNLNYASPASIMFHKMTVIAADFLFLFAVKYFATTCLARSRQRTNHLMLNPRLVLSILLMCNFGLFIIDHIHFQYNGFLFGLLLISVTDVYRGMYRSAALHFAALLNFKHIFLYMAPAYGVYMLRVYCFNSHKKDGSVIYSSFSIKKFTLLGGIVVSVFMMSFGPFIYMGQIGQVISRLFPFKRGLCHAYWAPNFWALYNIADKALYLTGRKLNVVPEHSAAAVMTGGLVQEFEHSVLPSIRPIATFILTVTLWQPTIIHLWLNPKGSRSFLKCLILCAFTSFMFGWHVHEKAILLVTIPLALLAVEDRKYAKHFLMLSVPANLSLFPLIFTPFEQPLLYFGFAAYTLFSFTALHSLSSAREEAVPLLRFYEGLYLVGFIPVMFYYSLGHRLLGLNDSLPFLPLLLMSVYCGLGVTYSYISLYWTVLKERMVIKIKQP